MLELDSASRGATIAHNTQVKPQTLLEQASPGQFRGWRAFYESLATRRSANSSPVCSCIGKCLIYRCVRTLQSWKTRVSMQRQEQPYLDVRTLLRAAGNVMAVLTVVRHAAASIDKPRCAAPRRCLLRTARGSRDCYLRRPRRPCLTGEWVSRGVA